MQKPALNEYGPFHGKYISLVGEGDYFSQLDENTAEVVQLFGGLSPERQNYRYGNGKWSLKEMLMHIIDTERVMLYRALVFGRGDVEATLPNMDQDLYAAGVNVDGRTMDDLLEEFVIVRQSSVKLLKQFSLQQSMNAGKMFGFPLTPRALAFIILGHAKHHITIAKEKYLK
ncbi:MAG: DinB family protein [Flavitalea sp.]